MDFNKIAEISQPFHRGRNVYSYYTECPNSEKVVSMVFEPLNEFPSVPYHVKILDSIPENRKAYGSFSDLVSKVFDSFGEDYFEKQIQKLTDANRDLLEIYHKRAPMKTSNL